MALMVYQSGFYHREIAFCRVYGSKSKSAVENVLLKNGISYFIQMQKESILHRTFSGKKHVDKTMFIFRIHESDVEKANDLLKEFDQTQIDKIGKE